MQTIEQLADALSQLSVLDMSKLKALLQEKWGVSAAMPMMAAVAAPVAAGAAPVAESTEFKVTLEEVPADKKISVIKVLRELISGLSLKDAKDMVDGAPKVVKDSVSKDVAAEFQKKITEAGGKVSLQGI
jgi:large subunit ribosomal protein L7/L12